MSFNRDELCSVQFQKPSAAFSLKKNVKFIFSCAFIPLFWVTIMFNV